MGSLERHGEYPGIGLAQVRLCWVGPADWRELRSVRLRALSDAPKAFLSDHGKEESWLEEDWRSVIRQARWVIARSAQGVIGVARSSQDEDSPERRYIEAVWVAPEFRRCGIGRDLVHWLIDHGRRSGIKEILLWVIDSNDHARRLYLRMGFRPTGRIQPVPGRETRNEELLTYVISGWRLPRR